MSDLTIWTDGSCYPNPGPGGWGFYGKAGSAEIQAFGGAARTTNNRMELSAVIAAMMALKAGVDAKIVSDSKYVVDGTSTVTNWARYGWTTSTGKPVANRDLWEIFAALRPHAKHRYEWTRGHVGTEGNEIADRLAGRGRQANGDEELTWGAARGPVVMLVAGTGTMPKEPKRVRTFLDEIVDIVKPTAAIYFAHLKHGRDHRGLWDVKDYEHETAFLSDVLDEQVVAPVRITVARGEDRRGDLFASCWPSTIVALPGADVSDIVAHYRSGSVIYAEEFL